MNTQAHVTFKCHINQIVMVKINALGMAHLYEMHITDCGVSACIRPEFKGPPTNEHGYSYWKMWHLMNIFGPCMGAGLHCPWDGDILMIEKDEQNG